MTEDQSDYDDIFDEKYQDIDISGLLEDDFDLMGEDKLNDWLADFREKNALTNGYRNHIAAAIDSGSLRIKREVARRMVRDA